MPAETRYAEALLSAAVSAGCADTVGQALSHMAAVWSENGDLRLFMRDPRITQNVKKETFDNILNGMEDAGNIFKHFMYLLVDNGRLGLLRGINSAYALLRDTREDRLTITAVTAEHLSQTQTAALCGIYKQRCCASSAVLVNIIDESVIGGIKIIIGDLVIDGTLAGGLQRLTRAVTETT